MMPSIMSNPGFDLFFWVIFLTVFGLLLPVFFIWSARGGQKKWRAVPQRDRAQPHNEPWPAYEQGYRVPQQEQKAELEGNPSVSEPAEPFHAGQDKIEITQWE